MTLKDDTKFKGKLTHGLKNDIRDLVNFHSSSRKSENLHFIGLLLSKAYKALDEKVKKIVKLVEFTFLENTSNGIIFTDAPPHSKLAPKFLSSRYRLKKITHCPRQHSFKNLFPPTAERGAGSYDLLY